MQTIIQRNHKNIRGYAEVLAGLPGVHVRVPQDASQQNCQYVVVEIDRRAAGICRDQLLQLLHAENVMARRYFHPGCHRLSCYAADPQPRLPATEAILERVLVLPTGLAVDDVTIVRLGTLIRSLLRHAVPLAQHWHRNQTGDVPVGIGTGRTEPAEGLAAPHLSTTTANIP